MQSKIPKCIPNLKSLPRSFWERILHQRLPLYHRTIPSASVPTFGRREYATQTVKFEDYVAKHNQVNDPSSPIASLQSRLSVARKTDDFLAIVEELENPSFQFPPNFVHNFVDHLLQDISFKLHTRDGRFMEQAADYSERALIACLGRLPVDHLRLAHHGDPGVVVQYPTRNMYLRTIIAWASTKKEEGAFRAEAIFRLMDSEHRREQQYLIKTGIVNSATPKCPAPCRKCYKSLIRAWSVSKAEIGATRASEILRRLEHDSGLVDLLNGKAVAIQRRDFPDLAMYNMLIQAFGNVPTTHSGAALSQTKEIVSRLARIQSITGDVEYQLDSYSFAAILRVYKRYVQFHHAPLKPEILKDVEHLVQRIQRQKHDQAWRRDGSRIVSDNASYGLLVETLIKSRPRIESLLRAHSIVLGLANQEDGLKLDVEDTSWPDQDLIISLIQAWEKFGQDRADDCVNRLVEIAAKAPFETSKSGGPRRIHTVHEMMETWERSGSKFAPQVIESFLERSVSDKDHEATGRTFYIALKAWSRSMLDVAPMRAEFVFDQLIRLHYKRGRRYEPRDIHVVLLFTLWIKRCVDGRRYQGHYGIMYPAEHIETHLDSICEREWAKNSVGHYAMAIRAWSEQVVGEGPDEPNPVEHTVALLAALEKRTGELASFPSNWALEACGRQQPTLERRRESYVAAIDIFQRCKRNPRTYVLMTKALCIQAVELDEDNVKAIEELFSECCSEGFLTEEMVSLASCYMSLSALQKFFRLSFQQASAVVQLRSKADDSPRWNGRLPPALLISSLPEQWSENAMKNQRRQKSVSYS